MYRRGGREIRSTTRSLEHHGRENGWFPNAKICFRQSAVGVYNCRWKVLAMVSLLSHGILVITALVYCLFRLGTTCHEFSFFRFAKHLRPNSRGLWFRLFRTEAAQCLPLS